MSGSEMLLVTIVPRHGLTCVAVCRNASGIPVVADAYRAGNTAVKSWSPDPQGDGITFFDKYGRNCAGLDSKTVTYDIPIVIR